MHLLTMPPGGRAKAHLHENHETAIYVLDGEAVTLTATACSTTFVHARVTWSTSLRACLICRST